MTTKLGDIVGLHKDGSDYNAEVTKVYEDQDYIDVRTVGLGGVAYQAVNPKPKGGVESSFYFETKPVSEQKEIRKEGEPDPLEVGRNGVQPGLGQPGSASIEPDNKKK